MIEVVDGEIKLLKVNKLEEAATGVDRTIKRTVTELKADHMTRVFITLYTIPCAAFGTLCHPRRNFWRSKRSKRCGLIHDKAFFELQQDNALIIMAQWLHRRIRASRYKRKQQKYKKRMNMNKEIDKPIMIDNAQLDFVYNPSISMVVNVGVGASIG